MGSGTVAISALKSKRNFAGYEIEPAYIELCNRRINAYLDQLIIDSNKI
jgi:DNA modification methylase